MDLPEHASAKAIEAHAAGLPVYITQFVDVLLDQNRAPAEIQIGPAVAVAQSELLALAAKWAPEYAQDEIDLSGPSRGKPYTIFAMASLGETQTAFLSSCSGPVTPETAQDFFSDHPLFSPVGDMMLDAAQARSPKTRLH